MQTTNILTIYFPNVITDIILEYKQFNSRLVNVISRDTIEDITFILEIPNKHKDLVTAGANIINIWRNNKCIDTLRGHTRSIKHLLVASNTDIISYCYDHTIIVWRHVDNISGTKIVKNAFNDILGCYSNYKNIFALSVNMIKNPEKCLVILPNNDLVFVVSSFQDYQSNYNKKTVKQYRNNILLHILDNFQDDVSILCPLKNSNLATGGTSGFINIWKDNICLKSLKDDSSIEIICELFNENLVTGNKRGCIKIWTDCGLTTTLIHNVENTDILLGPFSIIGLSNGDLASYIGGCSLKIWKNDTKNKNKYKLINEVSSSPYSTQIIKPFDNGFITYEKNYKIRIWRKNTRIATLYEYNYIFNNVYDLIVLSNNRLAGVSSENINIWE